MNLLLLLFALPIATIILASVLETILHSPIKVASIFFAIYLVVAFTAFDATFLIFVIAYTILAYISAVITRIILRFFHCINHDNDDDDSDNNVINTDSATINTVNTTVNTQNIGNGNNSSCGCNTRFRRF